MSVQQVGNAAVPGRLPPAAGGAHARSGSCARPAAISRSIARYARRCDFVTLTRTPELAAEVTLQPLRRFELDAAILFSDIMTPLQGMGVDLTFEPGPGGARAHPHATRRSTRCAQLVPERDVPFVLESIKLIRADAAARRAAHRLCRRHPSRCCVISCAASPRRSSAPRAPSCMRSPSRPSACSTSWRMPWPSISRAGRGGRAGADDVRVLGGAAGAAGIQPRSRCGPCGGPWRRCAAPASR